MEIIQQFGIIAGLAGLSLGVLLFLFRDIIAKNIFPTLTPEHGYKIIRMMLILVFSMSILGIMTWACLEYLKFGNRGNEKAEVPVEKKKFRCTVFEQVSTVSNSIKVLAGSHNLESDDILILNALQEKFIHYIKINDSCDENEQKAILQELEQAQIIIKKY